jgi:hypothetical protein
LQGRNIKARWVQRFAKKPPAEARAIALRSPGLTEALQGFASGFQQDLNHFSSGVNAMSLLRIRLDLASAPELREVWLDMFDDEEDAAFELTECESQFHQLSGAVGLSLQASRNALQKQWNPNPDEQLKTALSEASLAFASPTHRRTTLPGGAHRRHNVLGGAVREELAVFDQLQVRPEFVKEVSVALDEASSAVAPDTASTAAILGRVILLTGHMIDRPGRPTARFPPTPGVEKEARRLIEEAVIADARTRPERSSGSQAARVEATSCSTRSAKAARSEARCTCRCPRVRSLPIRFTTAARAGWRDTKSCSTT